MSAMTLWAPSRIAVQHDGAVQELGHAARALAVALDELHLILVLEFARQPDPDVAAARDDDAPRRRFLAPHLLHDHADVLACRQEKHLVAVLDDRLALGLDALARAVDRRDARVRTRYVLAQRTQRLPDERAALQRADTHESYASIGEVE